MVSSTQNSDMADQQQSEKNEWKAQAWVYFIWVVIGRRVYCKVGCSADPGSRLSQLQAGTPEEPFRIHLLPCLSIEQARLIEGMFHTRLKAFKTSGEWFSDPNVKRLTRALSEQMREILLLFETFEYESDIVQIDLDGKYPVLYDNGFVRIVVE